MALASSRRSGNCPESIFQLLCYLEFSRWAYLHTSWIYSLSPHWQSVPASAQSSEDPREGGSVMQEASSMDAHHAGDTLDSFCFHRWLLCVLLEVFPPCWHWLVLVSQRLLLCPHSQPTGVVKGWVISEEVIEVDYGFSWWSTSSISAAWKDCPEFGQ